MSATKPADLTLALQKATEGFTATVDRPTDKDLINIRQLLLPVLMKTKYDELTLTHNLLGVIMSSKRYGQIYKKEAYLIPPVIALYNDKIDKYATRTEVHRAEGKHKARINESQLYKTANNSCQKWIMAVVDETWYKEIEDPDTFYTKGTALKLLDHRTECFWGFTPSTRWISHKSWRRYSAMQKAYHNLSTRWRQHIANPSVQNSSSMKIICMLWRWSLYSNPVSKRLKPGSGWNSRRTDTPGRSGRPLSERCTSLSDKLKPHEGGRKNHLEDLRCLGRYQSHKGNKRRRGHLICRTKCLIRSMDTWTISRQQRLKWRLMEAWWSNWQLFWMYPWMRSPDSSLSLRLNAWQNTSTR